MAQKAPVPPAGDAVPAASDAAPARRRTFCNGTVWLTVSLLGVWALVTFGVAYFARDLSFDFFGWPFSFWVGSQGALMLYVLIVVLYARTMNRREAEAVSAAAPIP